MDVETAKTMVLGFGVVAAIIACVKTKGDKAFGFWLLAVLCALGAA